MVATDSTTHPSQKPTSQPPTPSLLHYRLKPLPFPEHVTVFLQRTPVQLRLLPQIRRQEAVAVADGDEGRFERVFERLGGAGRRRVRVLHAGELQETLDGGGGNEAGTAGGGDELCDLGNCERLSCVEDVIGMDVGGIVSG